MYVSFCPKCNRRFVDRTPGSADMRRDLHLIEHSPDVRKVNEQVEAKVLEVFGAIVVCASKDAPSRPQKINA